MKKNLITLIRSRAVVLCCVMTTAVFTACTDNDDNPVIPDTPTDQAEYAILFYAYGGGTLDLSIVSNMKDFFKGKAESYNQVKIAVQYKFSSEDNLKSNWIDYLLNYNYITQETADRDWAHLKPMGQQTVRFIVDPTVENPNDDIVNEQNIYGQKNCDITSVDSLTNFINWATKACPAKHYVLVLADHGGGYMPHDDLTFAAQTRGLLYDNVSPSDPAHRITASSLKYALEHANARMDVIYMDACLMNTVEYQFELKDVADYLVLSTFSVPGEGGSYSFLIDELATSDLETALSNYNKATVEKWDKMAASYFAAGYPEFEWDYHDMTVTRTRNLDAFGEKFRVFVDKLVAAYADEGNKAKIDTITKYAFKVDSERPSYDLVGYAKSITLALPDVFDAAFSNELASAYNSCLVSQYCSDFLMKKGWSVDCSIILAVKGNYYVYCYNEEDPSKIESYMLYYADGRIEEYKYVNPELIKSTNWGSTLDDTYEKLAFDKATGWSRWLYLNEQLPCENSPVLMNSLFDDIGYIKVR